MAAGSHPVQQEDQSHDQQYCTQTSTPETTLNGCEIMDTRDSKCSLGT
jgi:hypothetical protein